MSDGHRPKGHQTQLLLLNGGPVLTFDQDGDVAVVTQQALLVEGAQHRGAEVWDLHMEQLRHGGGGRGGGGRGASDHRKHSQQEGHL